MALINGYIIPKEKTMHQKPLPHVLALLLLSVFAQTISAGGLRPHVNVKVTASALGDYGAGGDGLFDHLSDVGDTDDSETAFLFGLGAQVDLHDLWTVDFGVGTGSATVVRALDQAPELPGRAEIDADLYAASLLGRFHPWGRGGVSPFVVAGVRVLHFDPEGGELSVGADRVTLPRDEISSSTQVDLVAGLGMTVPLTQGASVDIEGQYGFDSGWQAGAGLAFSLDAIRLLDPSDRLQLPPGCEIHSVSPETSAAGDPVTMSGLGFGDPSVQCSLGFEWTSSRDGSLGSLPTVTTDDLSVGAHQLCFTVTYEPIAGCSNPPPLSCRQCVTHVVEVPDIPDGRYCGETDEWWEGEIGSNRVHYENHLNRGTTRIRGTDGDDLILGNSQANRIIGDGGDDCIYGFSGNDLINGDRTGLRPGISGDDWIVAGAGEDHLRGDAGNDRLYGGEGHDYLEGDSGHDRMFGEGGRDTLHGDSGNDHLVGGDGNDRLKGDSGRDTLDGGGGDDWMKGDSGRDTLEGGDGDDWLKGDSGRDTLRGGPGADKLKGDSGRDHLDGGSGNDFLKGDSGRDRLFGQSGNDRLCGNSGRDTNNGGSGTDSCRSPRRGSSCERRAARRDCTTAAWNRW